MARIAYVDFSAYFTDEAEYQLALAVSEGKGMIYASPFEISQLFGMTWPPPGGAITQGSHGLIGFPPYTLGVPPVQINSPNPSGKFMDGTVAEVSVPAQAGNPASTFPASTEPTLYRWCCTLQFMNFNATAAPSVTPIPPRRWITGFEQVTLNEGGLTNPSRNSCRDSSRTIDGFGMPVRGQINVNAMNRRVDEYIAGFTPHTSWERFYVRVRALPTAGSHGIWRCNGNAVANAGGGYKISTTGGLEIYSISTLLVQTLRATIPGVFLPINTWVRIDTLLKYDLGGGTDGHLRTFINGVLVNTYTSSAGNDMNGSQFHGFSQLGKWDGPADNNVEIDFDDWICADVPNILGVESLDSADWYVGSHVVQANSDSASLGTWAGSRGVLNQGIASQKQFSSTLTNSNAGATVEGVTDYSDDSLTVGIVAGAVAAVVGQVSSVVAGTNGQLGYKIAGGVAVMATVDELAAPASTSVLYRPNPNLPTVIEPFSVVKTKSADGNLTTQYSLMASIEQIGVWGPEDDPSFEEPVTRVGFLHNSAFAKSMWGYIPATPYSPVFAVGGTYVGNGTYQEVLLPGPCHYLFIRAISGGPTAAIQFFGPMIAPHFGQIIDASPQVRVWADASGNCKFSVNGTNINCNQNTIVYQYVAFCDPGMRFNITGVYMHDASGLATQNNSLLDSNFLPEFAMIASEVTQSTNVLTGEFFSKGPGNSGVSGQNMQGGAAIASYGSLLTGILQTRSGVHNNSAEQMVYSLWRSIEQNCVNVMCQILTYTGNGSSSRVIPLTPAGGRFPLFAMVMPVGGNAVFRDPSHTGSNSSILGSMGNTIQGITAGGIDSITVGTNLNTNLTVYNVFVILGDTLGWNNGTYFPSDCVPPDGPYDDPEPLAGVNMLGNGGLTLGGVPSLTLLKDISGIYTLIPGKLNDTLIDRQTGQPSVDVEIPDPTFKTGYIGG